MIKKLSFLVAWIMLASVSQACVASNKKQETSQITQNQTSQSQTSQDQIPQSEVPQKHTSQTRDAVYKSSPYKPAGLLGNLDFEDEEIIALKDKKGDYDALVYQLPGGEKTIVAIQYQGGNVNDRRARITTGPEDRENHTLHYWLKNARVPGQRKGQFKGRIQVNVPGLNETSLFQRYRFYLHPDLALYRQDPKLNTWFSLSALWMGTPWKGHEYPFNIVLNLAKPAGVGAPLYFTAKGSVRTGGAINRGKWKDVWGEAGWNFEVPVGEWIDIEIGYKAGDKNTGRFYMAAKREKDKVLTTIFDITNWTYHPKSPKLVPVTFWNPLKLYSGSRIIHFIRDKGGVAQLYWDDFEIYKNW